MYVTSNVTFPILGTEQTNCLALVYELASCYKILPHFKFHTLSISNCYFHYFPVGPKS